jgi:leucyl aminopeptidase
MTLAEISLLESVEALANSTAELLVVPLEEDTRDASTHLVDLASALGVGIGDMVDFASSSSTTASARAFALVEGDRRRWVTCARVPMALPPAVAYRLAGMAAADQVVAGSSLAVYVPSVDDGLQRALRLIEGLTIARPALIGESRGFESPAASLPDAPEEVRRALVIAQAVDWCRRLVNASSSELTPARLVEAADRMAEAAGARSRVWSSSELESEGFGGILAVGGGSTTPAAMAELRVGEGTGPALTLVGKGVTCDTGGLQIKTSDHEWLWADMAGAGAVVAASWAAAALGVEVDLRALIPCVENMPGPGAYRPGDIVTHRNGGTSEIRHTDAEGRLVLADVLAYAAEAEPGAIVDVATLTDDLALGPDLWPVLANDQRLADLIVSAGAAAGDPGWQLPLWPGYLEATASHRADRTNAGVLGKEGVAGSILGGLFLQPFAAGIPWAHIDIAGTAIKTADVSPWRSGATGSSTAALIRLVEDFSAGGLP